MEACWAHNPEVRGSKPRSASFSFCHLQGESSHFRQAQSNNGGVWNREEPGTHSLKMSSDNIVRERSVGVAVITSALHAEGRQFEPGTDHMFCLHFVPTWNKHVRMAEWSKAPDSRLSALSLDRG